MSLLLLNINHLRHHFFIKTMQKNIMDFEHPTPYPTMRLETIRSIIPISCRRYPKSVWNTSA